jgi:hypothetical protein
MQPPPEGDLLEVPADDLGHLEHGHLVFAEYSLQFFIGIDHALIGGVLKVIRLDVVPNFLCHFSARHRVGTNHSRQFGTRGQRLHETRISRALGNGLLG